MISLNPYLLSTHYLCLYPRTVFDTNGGRWPRGSFYYCVTCVCHVVHRQCWVATPSNGVITVNPVDGLTALRLGTICQHEIWENSGPENSGFFLKPWTVSTPRESKKPTSYLEFSVQLSQQLYTRAFVIKEEWFWLKTSFKFLALVGKWCMDLRGV